MTPVGTDQPPCEVMYDLVNFTTVEELVVVTVLLSLHADVVSPPADVSWVAVSDGFTEFTTVVVELSLKFQLPTSPEPLLTYDDIEVLICAWVRVVLHRCTSSYEPGRNDCQVLL